MSAVEPKVGDIVVYVGVPSFRYPGAAQTWLDRRDKQIKFLVTGTFHGAGWLHDGNEQFGYLHELNTTWLGDKCYARLASLRVVRRASYEDVAS